MKLNSTSRQSASEYRSRAERCDAKPLKLQTKARRLTLKSWRGYTESWQRRPQSSKHLTKTRSINERRGFVSYLRHYRFSDACRGMVVAKSFSLKCRDKRQHANMPIQINVPNINTGTSWSEMDHQDLKGWRLRSFSAPMGRK
jgi:hypothetical protein